MPLVGGACASRGASHSGSAEDSLASNPVPLSPAFVAGTDSRLLALESQVAQLIAQLLPLPLLVVWCE